MSRTPRVESRYESTSLREAIDAQGIRYIWIAEQLKWSKQRLNGVMNGEATITHDEAQEVAQLLRVPLRLLFKLQDRSFSEPLSEEQIPERSIA